MTDPSTEEPGGGEPAPAALRSAADIAAPLEALLLLADEPVSETDLAQALDVPVATVADALAELVAFYEETGRGFELRQLGGGWRYYTRAEHADLISAYVLEGQQARLSQAALETLAVVAYSQPVSRARIAAVRGVNVDGVVRTLLARGLITEAGHDADSGAVVFATTGYFLERMGMQNLDDLPPLAPHLPEAVELEAELSALATAARPRPVEDPGPGPGAAPGDGSPTVAEPGGVALSEEGERDE